MSDAVLSAPVSSRPLRIALIVARVVFGLVFLFAAFAKISGQPMMVAEFGQIGVGQWFRYLTGFMELVGALLLIRPNTVTYGAGLLALVSIGALGAQIMFLHQDVVHTIVFALILGWIAYSYRSQRMGG